MDTFDFALGIEYGPAC